MIRADAVAPEMTPIASPVSSLSICAVRISGQSVFTEERYISLDRHERHRANLFKLPEQRARYVTTWYAVRHLIADHPHFVGFPLAEIPIRRSCRACGATDHGKPFIDGDRQSPLHFSVSHGNSTALVVTAPMPVGIDVEDYQPSQERMGALDAVVRRALSADEVKSIATLKDHTEGVLRAWVRKEAAVKATGHGLLYPFRSLPVLHTDLVMVDGRSVTLADLAVAGAAAAVAWIPRRTAPPRTVLNRRCRLIGGRSGC